MKRQKVLLFYNPFAGNGLFRTNLDYILERIQNAGYQPVPVRASREYPLREILADIDPSEYRQIIAGGGDGTINICVNAMVQNGIRLPLGILPAGTANDFAYYFEIPNELEEMLDVALGDAVIPADVGVCNDRYFINVAALGSLVDVSQKTDPTLKNTLGALAYYLKGATELKSLKPLPVTLITPDKVHEEKILFMIVMNGKSAGGFRHVSPHSEISDGLLDVIAFREMPLVELTTLLPRIMQGSHIQHKKVLYFETPRLTIKSAVEIPTDVDGEHGEKLPLRFSVLENYLQVFSRHEPGSDNPGKQGSLAKLVSKARRTD